MNEAPEGRDALVFFAVLGGGLRLDEDALEILARFVVRREEGAIAREEVAALAGLEVGHEPQEHLGVVGELEVVLDEPIELLLELLVRERRAIEAHAEHGDDQQRRQEDAPEERAREETHV